jgi:hypothetical protein
MREIPALSETEYQLIVELLEREQAQLPHEIHHTDIHAAKDFLRNRLELVDALLIRLRPLATAA